MLTLPLTAVGALSVNEAKALTVYLPEIYRDLFQERADIVISDDLIYLVPGNGYKVMDVAGKGFRYKVAARLSVLPGLSASHKFSATKVDFTRTTFGQHNAISTPLLAQLIPKETPQGHKFLRMTPTQILASLRDDMQSAKEIGGLGDWRIDKGVLHATVKVEL